MRNLKVKIIHIIVISILAVCATGIVISNLIVYWNFQTQIRQARIAEGEAQLSFYHDIVDKCFDEMETNCLLIMRNYDIQTTIRSSAQKDLIELLKERMYVTNRIALLAQARTLQDFNVALCLDDGRFFVHSGLYGHYIDDTYYTSNAFYQRVTSCGGTVWEFSELPYAYKTKLKDWIRVGMPVRNSQTNIICGVISCEISMRELEKDLQCASTVASVHLIDPATNSVILHTGEDEVGTGMLFSSELSNGWILRVCMKDNIISVDSSWLWLQIFGVVAAMMLIGLLVVFLLKRQISLPLNKLLRQMETFPLKETDTTSIIVEVNDLYKGYNRLLTQIDYLVHVAQKTEKENQRANLAMLHAQIDPHFLYNSLDMIAWKMRDGDVQESGLLLLDFAKYYRYSLSMGRTIVPVDQELERIGLYLKIISVRYLSQIEYEVDASGVHTSPLYCYKMLLQPIVENAIQHGILQTESQSGKICVTAREKGDSLYFDIWDNGVGMSAEYLAALSEKLKTADIAMIRDLERTGHGYGLLNIAFRFHLLGCDRHCIKIESEEGSYTRVEIKIPLIKKEEDVDG